MASTFFGLNIGRTGLYAYQAALDTTAHNISNTETEGYTRQVLGIQASKAIKVNSTYGMVGTGVDVTGVKQLRDEYYDEKYRKNNMILGEYSTKANYMTSIQNYFNEVTLDGFTKTFNSLYDSLQEVANNPSSLTARNEVINYGMSLAEYFNSLAGNLKSIQEDCNFEIRNMVGKINSIAQQIATITKQINTVEINGITANDLRDQRALLVDELSQIVNVSVSENVVGDGVGVTSYVVTIDGQTLVDTGEYNQLKVVPREKDKRINQNDIDGLYDVYWENGQKFNLASPSLGGSLKALYELRDGNNMHNLRGTANGKTGEKTLVLTGTTINDMKKLNIPQEGVITVGNQEIAYEGFEVKIGSDGKYTYTFALKKELTSEITDTQAAIGERINYKGIPYYLDRLNEFVRTYAKAFNDLHRTGKDLNNDVGMDFFTATHKANGREYVFGPYAGSDDLASYDNTTFNSQTGIYYKDVPSNNLLYGSYYLMTAENFTVNSKLLDDPNKFAAATDVLNGVDRKDVVERLIALRRDKTIFDQGDPAGFMQSLVADIGIDTKKASNFSGSQENIIEAITNQKLSISGVDIDDEAMGLIRYQNAYNLSAKVISVMNEIYDKLINDMGV